MNKTLLILSLLHGHVALFASDVKMHVVDETGAAIPEAHATIIFGMIRNGADDVRNGADDVRNGLTDKEGVFRATGRADHSIWVRASKSGHYESKIERLQKDGDHNLTVVIPRVLSPIPLRAYAADIGGLSGYIPLAAQNEWLGFDLEAGDWAAPHGKGKVTDIRFRFKNEFKGYKDYVKLEREIEYGKKVAASRKQEWFEDKFLERFKVTAGKWDAELEIAFPGEKEGMHEVAGEQFLPYSQMKMPHQAPADGYVPTWRYEAKSYSPPGWRENAGFFLRTRVKLDKDNNIISAHYTKVMGDFYVFAPGGISFTYYFNPTPNDRNLEFDPKRNLFPKDKPGANVFNP